MNEDVGRRSQKKQQTQNDIIAAALELFDEWGYDETSIEEIAEAAGVSRRTFFRYFPSKDAVVFPHSEARLAIFQSMLASHRKKDDPLDTLQNAFVTIGEDYMANRKLIGKQSRVIRATPSLADHDQNLDLAWEETVAQFLQKHHRRCDKSNAGLVAGALVGALRAAIRQWQANHRRTDLLDLSNQIFSMIQI